MNIENKIKEATTKQLIGSLVCLVSLLTIGYVYAWPLAALIFVTIFGSNIEMAAKIAKIIYKNIK